MKTLFLSLILFVSTFISAQEKENRTITVTIDKVLNDRGQVLFALHSAETFMKGSGVQNLISEIKNGKASVTFKNVPPGTYAIIALHDENKNNRMDFEANGMPKEYYGTSNNVTSFGPPQFDSAKFTIDDTDLDFAIRF